MSRRKKEDDPPVIIMRSGYATDALWRAAIVQAHEHERDIMIIDEEGKHADHRQG